VSERIRLGVALLFQKDGVYVRHNTNAGHGHVPEHGLQLLVVLEGQHYVPGLDCLALEIAGYIAGQLQHLGYEVLERARHHHSAVLAHHQARIDALELSERFVDIENNTS
jgi:hypothetical protein